MSDETMKVWSWRQAVEKAKLEPTTKLVLYTLANHMNEHGAGCFPSVETLVEGTGLSNRAVILHINKAVEAQFLIKSQHGFRGQKWRRNEYRARFPNNAELDKCLGDKGSDAGSPPLQQEGSDAKSLAFTEGGDFNGKKVVTQGHTNSPYNSPDKKEITNVISKKADDYPPGFEAFWQAYPKNRASKAESLKVYNRAIKGGATPPEIEQGARAYAAHISKSPEFTAHATTWLNGQRWTVEYSTSPGKYSATAEMSTPGAKYEFLLRLQESGRVLSDEQKRFVQEFKQPVRADEAH